MEQCLPKECISYVPKWSNVYLENAFHMCQNGAMFTWRMHFICAKMEQCLPGECISYVPKWSNVYLKNVFHMCKNGAMFT